MSFRRPPVTVNVPVRGARAAGASSTGAGGASSSAAAVARCGAAAAPGWDVHNSLYRWRFVPVLLPVVLRRKAEGPSGAVVADPSAPLGDGRPSHFASWEFAPTRPPTRKHHTIRLMAVSLTIFRRFPAPRSSRNVCAPAQKSESLSLGSTEPAETLEAIRPKSGPFPEMPTDRAQPTTGAGKRNKKPPPGIDAAGVNAGGRGRTIRRIR